MSRRAQIRKLAKTDNLAALKLVPTLVDIREQIQALAWVARYTEPKRMQSIVDTAMNKATVYVHSESDIFAPVLALAWLLRALQETGNLDSMQHVRDSALEMVPSVNPCSSRTECYGALLNAVIPAGLIAANPIIDSMLVHCIGDVHWRIVRAFTDSALLVNGFSKGRAFELSAAIADEKKRETLNNQLQAGKTTEPRKFFW
jgi:hypothetical protein